LVEVEAEGFSFFNFSWSRFQLLDRFLSSIPR
jgi:hypothetical protein